VWAYGRGQTDTQTRVTTIHFESSTTHAKCNEHFRKGQNKKSLLASRDKKISKRLYVCGRRRDSLPRDSERVPDNCTGDSEVPL